LGIIESYLEKLEMKVCGGFLVPSGREDRQWSNGSAGFSFLV